MDVNAMELRECLKEVLQAYAEEYVIPPSRQRLKEAIDEGWILVKAMPSNRRMTEIAKCKKAEEGCNSSFVLWLSTALGLIGGALGMQSLVLTDPKVYPSSLTMAFLILMAACAVFAFFFLVKIIYIKYRMYKLHYGRYINTSWRWRKFVCNWLGCKVSARGN